MVYSTGGERAVELALPTGQQHYIDCMTPAAERPWPAAGENLNDKYVPELLPYLYEFRGTPEFIFHFISRVISHV